jgi:hypothetical protein
MDGYTEIDADGVYTLVKGNERLVIPSDATVEEINQIRLAFFGPDLSLPEPFSMHRLRQFLIVTNRTTQVTTWINSLLEPQKSLAREEFEYAPDFKADSAFGRAIQTALALNDADYAELTRTAATYSVEDYGDTPVLTLAQRIAKFLIG